MTRLTAGQHFRPVCDISYAEWLNMEPRNLRNHLSSKASTRFESKNHRFEGKYFESKNWSSHPRPSPSLWPRGAVEKEGKEGWVWLDLVAVWVQWSRASPATASARARTIRWRREQRLKGGEKTQLPAIWSRLSMRPIMLQWCQDGCSSP
jgi:hypothetical protein